MNDDNPATGSPVAPANDAQVEADKVTAQPNEADVQVKSEAPEVTQQPEGSAEVKTEDKVEDGLILGKFKSQEDLTRAYTELESQRTKDAQEKAELTRILNETFAPEPEAPAPVTETIEPEEPDPVTVKLAAMERKDAVRDFVFLHPDADGSAVNKILKDDPVIANINGYEAKLEYAYLKSKSIASPKAIEDAKKQTATETQAKIVEKQAAQVEGARQQSQPTQPDELSTEDLRSAMRSDKTFDDLIQKKFPGISKMRAQT